MIQIQDLRKKFNKIQALYNINATFRNGQVISLIGPNGSGKTTLIKSILGMVKPDSGKIIVNDQVVNNDPSYKKYIGYMPQIGRYPDNLKIGQLFSMMKNIRVVADNELDMDLINGFNLKQIFDKPLRTLSGGTRQKVSAALAFYFNPEILILDEPTAGLDPLSSELLKEKILLEKDKNKLMIITSHILSDLDELTTHVMYLQEGKMIFYKKMDDIREETGQDKLGKAIAYIMMNENEKIKMDDDLQKVYEEVNKF